MFYGYDKKVMPVKYVTSGMATPLMPPGRYMGLATAALLVVAGCVLAAVNKRDRWSEPWVERYVLVR